MNETARERNTNPENQPQATQSGEIAVPDAESEFDESEPTPVEIPEESSERRGIAGLPGGLVAALKEASDKVATAPGLAPVQITVTIPPNYYGALAALGQQTGLYGSTPESTASVILMEGVRDAIAAWGIRPGPPEQGRIVAPGMPVARRKR